MPTRTQRILDRLPHTFLSQSSETHLYALVDAFGQDFLEAENSLTAIMAAHFVDLADRGQDEIDDLKRIAALYGLSPREDETIEEFREHLKRYVRTFLEGTVTVQGIFRVTAEALALRIADGHEELDTWWKRDSDVLVTYDSCGQDVAKKLFGIQHIRIQGEPIRPAQIVGSVKLGNTVDLTGAFTLHLEVNDMSALVDLAQNAEKITAVKGHEIVKAINDVFNADRPIAALNAQSQLVLTAPHLGADSQLTIAEGENDAALQVLGLLSRVYQPAPPQFARITGTAQWNSSIDLSERHFMRLAIDEQIEEINLGSGLTSIGEIAGKINAAFGTEVASVNDDNQLVLTSPTANSSSRIVIQKAASQTASAFILGAAPTVATGRDAQPARLVGQLDIRQGVDLSERGTIWIGLGDQPPRAIFCGGPEPTRTNGDHIAAVINSVLNAEIASFDGRILTLTAPPNTTLVLGNSEGDASDLIFGVRNRAVTGSIGGYAQFTGHAIESGQVNLYAQHILRIGLDHDSAQDIELYDYLSDDVDLSKVELNQVAQAINKALGEPIVTSDAKHLSLQSTRRGSGSQIRIEPLQIARRRRFVNRAVIIDEASRQIFGFVHQSAQGQADSNARFTGTVDLGRGVDLSTRLAIRLIIDQNAPLDIRVAGKRPRATLITEIVQQINTALQIAAINAIASHDGNYISLASNRIGIGSRIDFEPSRLQDAREILLGADIGTYYGEGARDVTFTGTVDLSSGIDLSTNRMLRLSVNGAEPLEIDCAAYANNPQQATPAEIAFSINHVLGVHAAQHDGQHVLLTTNKQGEEASLEFLEVSENDATHAIFGINAPRLYKGTAATPARVQGTATHSEPIDLSTRRFLVLSIDSKPDIVIDCVPEGSDETTVSLEQVVDAINAVLDESVASQSGNHLILQSPTAGNSSRITLKDYVSGDAKKAIFGDVQTPIKGDAPQPAIIRAEIPATQAINLSKRRIIRLAVNDGFPVDIDVAGEAPNATSTTEVVKKINAVFPNVASIVEDRLQLTSPTEGANSKIHLQPLRYLEIIEYPQITEKITAQTESQPENVMPDVEGLAVRHASKLLLNNRNAVEGTLELILYAPHGTTSPGFANLEGGFMLRILDIVERGGTLHIEKDDVYGVQASVQMPNGQIRPIEKRRIQASPLGDFHSIPFVGMRRLNGGNDDDPFILLNNPYAPNVLKFEARTDLPDSDRVYVTVTDSQERFDEAAFHDGLNYLYGILSIDKNNRYQLWNHDDTAEADFIQLVSMQDLPMQDFVNSVVLVSGYFVDDDWSILQLDTIARVFDVALFYPSPDTQVEQYLGVTIGDAIANPFSLTQQLHNSNSQLVHTELWKKSTCLNYPRGQSHWVYVDGSPTRFAKTQQDGDNKPEYHRHRLVEERDHFGTKHIRHDIWHARFADGASYEERGIYNVSLYSKVGDVEANATMASKRELPNNLENLEPYVYITLNSQTHQAGNFILNLPAELDPRFGARFNQQRFIPQKPEFYEQVVTEPVDDPKYMVELINTKSKFLTASFVTGPLRLGEQAIEMPFRKPQYLKRVLANEPPHLYITEEGLNGYIRLDAKAIDDTSDDSWGLEVYVTARRSGPAIFDLTVMYEGARLENARMVVLGKDINKKGQDPYLPIKIQDLVKPGLIGILQAKAAGVRAYVERQLTNSDRLFPD